MTGFDNLPRVRRFLFLGAVFGTVAACGSLVGVKDLEVVDQAPGDIADEAGSELPDVELLPDTSKFEADDGIVVEPPVDAGCDATALGPFVPTTFRVEDQASNKMSWIGDANNVKKDDDNAYVLQSFAQTSGATVSRAVKFQGFKPGVPDNKRIVGIGVELKAKSSDANFFKDHDLRVKLNADGTITSGNHADPAPWPTKYESRTYGGDGTLWELEKSLTPEAVNGPDFGVVYILEKPNNNGLPAFYLTLVQLTLYVCD